MQENEWTELTFFSLNNLRTVLKYAAIEDASDNLTDVWVHPILYLQYIYSITCSHHPLEQTLVVALFNTHSGEHCRWQLIRVAD